LTPGALRAWLAARDYPAYRATQVLSWIYRRRVARFAAMSDVPHELRERLAADFTFPTLTPTVVARSSDGTRKLLFELDERAAIEAVIIPDPPRLTLCISSQAGCGMGCVFCATARLGLLRNLSATEIAGQVLAAQGQLLPEERISNIVFMGMGEPLANYDAVVQAIELLTADWGIGLSARRITVSTVGVVPAMERLVHDTTVNLAVSLTATTDEQRARLMPINRRYKIETLLSACDYYTSRKKQRLTFEYILIADVNDLDEQARLLARHAKRLSAKVNLIPYNTVHGLPWSRPSEDRQEAFLSILRARGVAATLRREKGHDIDAACGQLRLQTKRELLTASS